MRLLATLLLLTSTCASAGIIRQDVRHLSKSGSTGLIGDVTLSEGANITLTQVGQNIAISGSASGCDTCGVAVIAHYAATASCQPETTSGTFAEPTTSVAACPGITSDLVGSQFTGTLDTADNGNIRLRITGAPAGDYCLTLEFTTDGSNGDANAVRLTDGTTPGPGHGWQTGANQLVSVSHCWTKSSGTIVFYPEFACPGGSNCGMVNTSDNRQTIYRLMKVR
jgi:hypothetical protein